MNTMPQAGPAPMDEARPTARAGIAFGEVVAAALLGFAETTFFFLVPEVLVTFIAMQGRLRAALLAAVAAMVGGVLGGWMLFAWGATASPKVITAYLDVIPGVSRDMVGEALAALRLQGAGALFTVPLADIPDKVLAALAGQTGMQPGTFLPAFAAALLLRFAAAAVLAYALAALLRRFFPGLRPAWLWGAVWAFVYGLWMAFLPN